MYKVLIVDDHPLIRSVMKLELTAQNYEVVGDVSTGSEAIQFIRDHPVDLVILDIGLPGVGGLDVLNRIKPSYPKVRVLVLTSYQDSHFSQQCMRAGANGFITKTKGMEDVLRGVKLVMDGYSFFPSVGSSSVRNSDGSLSEQALIEGLSGRELTILLHLARGLSNKQIAQDMILSIKPISTYKTRLKEKLKIYSVVFLADFAKHNVLP